jgi:ribosomal-protein-alanine N-acetyltransferase
VSLEIRPLAGQPDAEWCARTMCGSEPWLTLGRSYLASLEIVQNPEREVWLAWQAETRAGFAVLNLKGAFVGYVQTLCIAEPSRGRGLGSELLAFCEARLFRDFKNVFLCVSSFNPRARALYERLGYESVGALRDFVVAGHDEILMRKTRGPLFEAPQKSG